MEDIERLGDGINGGLLRRRLVSGIKIAGADFARILRETQGGIGGARHIGVKRADQIEHGAVDHRPLGRRLGIEPRELMLVAEILHDGAAFPDDALGQALGFDHRRHVRRVHRQEFLRTGLAVDIVLGEVEFRRAHEYPRRHVVYARLQHMQFHRSHFVPPVVMITGTFSMDSWATGRPRAKRCAWPSAARWHRPDGLRRCYSRPVPRGYDVLRTAHRHG